MIAHPAETREETVYVTDRPARTEEVVTGWIIRYVCGCGTSFGSFEEYEAHSDSYAGTEAFAVHNHYQGVEEPITETVSYPEEGHTETVTVVVREAWEETVLAYRCRYCHEKPAWAQYGWED